MGEELQPSLITLKNRPRWLMCFHMDFEVLEIKRQKAGTPQELWEARADTY